MGHRSSQPCIYLSKTISFSFSHLQFALQYIKYFTQFGKTFLFGKACKNIANIGTGMILLVWENDDKFAWAVSSTDLLFCFDYNKQYHTCWQTSLPSYIHEIALSEGTVRLRTWDCNKKELYFCCGFELFSVFIMSEPDPLAQSICCQQISESKRLLWKEC